MIAKISSKLIATIQRLCVKFIVTLGFTGSIPIMPGTMGSAASTVILYTSTKTSTLEEKPYIIYAIFLVGYITIHQYLKHSKSKDPKEVVIDEMLGIFIAGAINEYTAQKIMDIPVWLTCTLTFVLFRVFDILKPFPVSWADKKIKGAMGVIMDDVLAALISSLVFAGILLFASIYGYGHTLSQVFQPK